LRHRFGWYAGGEIQPVRQWSGGVRYDWTQFPVDSGREWAIEPYISYYPSEFLRFRVGYKHTERKGRDLFQTNGGSGSLADEVFVQGSFILGAHPAHPF
jgi:hypothetical protein